jgi:hypothetical protein
MSMTRRITEGRVETSLIFPISPRISAEIFLYTFLPAEHMETKTPIAVEFFTLGFYHRHQGGKKQLFYAPKVGRKSYFFPNSRRGKDIAYRRNHSFQGLDRLKCWRERWVIGTTDSNSTTYDSGFF